MLCRIRFNNVTQKNLLKLLSDYNVSNLHDCKQRTVCNKKLFPAVEKKNNFCSDKETAYYCFHVLKLNQACININFIKHIFESYGEGVDYTSQNLDIENKLTE